MHLLSSGLFRHCYTPELLGLQKEVVPKTLSLSLISRCKLASWFPCAPAVQASQHLTFSECLIFLSQRVHQTRVHLICYQTYIGLYALCV